MDRSNVAPSNVRAARRCSANRHTATNVRSASADVIGFSGDEDKAPERIARRQWLTGVDGAGAESLWKSLKGGLHGGRERIKKVDPDRRV